ncbi:MAG TPA: FtsX-like permease family protein [Fimbriiglobus sp.]|nr:FtsX-like permease family protein [Fimbriiglobus sp.]
MGYALQILWHEKTRYAAGIGAVAFSAVLIALQVGLLLGLFEITSIPVDHAPADVWVGAKDVPSVDLGRPIPVGNLARLDRPGVSMPEFLYVWFANWTKPQGGTNLCTVIGSSLEPNAVGAADVLTPELRTALSEPMTVVLDRSDLGKLGVHEIDDRAKINGHEVRLVGIVDGLRSLAAPWVFCSQTTARTVLSGIYPPDHVTYMLLRCESDRRARELADELHREYPEMSAYTADEFSFNSRWYWLTRTKAGIAIGYAALLGLLVGALITAQTLFSATMASAKEFATLLALGIPRRKIGWMVLAQSFWVGVLGVAIALPVVWGLAKVAEAGGVKVDLRWQVLAGAAVLTQLTALAAGLFALRSVRQIEPMSLLR